MHDLVDTATVHLVAADGLGQALAGPLSAALQSSGRWDVAGRPIATDAATVGVLLADVGADASRRVAQWRAVGVPSLTVLHRHPDVRVGPLDVPQTRHCLWCAEARARQHAGAAVAPGDGPVIATDGFSPALLTLLVALVRDRLQALAEAHFRRPTVTTVHTGTLAFRTSVLVPIARCRFCGTAPIGHGAEQSMFAGLVEALR